MQQLSLADRVRYRAQQYSFLANATVLQETARIPSSSETSPNAWGMAYRRK